MEHPFEHIPSGQLESLNALQDQLANDEYTRKVNLMYGVYRPDDGHPLVLPSIKEAKLRLSKDDTWNHEYPPSHLGTKTYRGKSAKLMFGANHSLVLNKCLVTMQALGASGACHAGALFLKLHYGPWKGQKSPKVFIPAESWANHPNVFTFLGLEAVPLPYYDQSTQSLAFESFKNAIDALPPQSVIVLQTSSQNPTGCDPSSRQWQQLAEIFRNRGHFAFFDAAYLGFVSGDVFVDAESVRIFADAGVSLLLAATYGKAFGLYGERVGFLSVSAPNIEVARRIEVQMKLIARAETGAMPAFGARLVEMILTDSELRDIWEADVKAIAKDLRERRIRLRRALEDRGSPGEWRFLTEQVGMFSFMPFDDGQIKSLREKHHVYVQDNGRISIAGLNFGNMQHVADSIDDIVRDVKLDPSQLAH